MELTNNSMLNGCDLAADQVSIEIREAKTRAITTVYMEYTAPMSSLFGFIYNEFKLEPENFVLMSKNKTLSPFKPLSYYVKNLDEPFSVSFHTNFFINNWKTKAETAPMLYQRAIQEVKEGDDPKKISRKLSKYFMDFYREALHKEIFDEAA